MTQLKNYVFLFVKPRQLFTKKIKRKQFRDRKLLLFLFVADLCKNKMIKHFLKTSLSSVYCDLQI